MPKKPVGTEEVAAAAAFLLSPGSSGINAQPPGSRRRNVGELFRPRTDPPAISGPMMGRGRRHRDCVGEMDQVAMLYGSNHG